MFYFIIESILNKSNTTPWLDKFLNKLDLIYAHIISITNIAECGLVLLFLLNKQNYWKNLKYGTI